MALQGAPASDRQRLFTRYLIATLVDLVVLNLFVQMTDSVAIATFATSLLAAFMLQLLLQATLTVEHKVAESFSRRSGTGWKVLRIVTAWFILFASKFVMLGVIDSVLGADIEFRGPLHGAVTLIGVIFAMVLAEAAVLKLYRALA